MRLARPGVYKGCYWEYLGELRVGGQTRERRTVQGHGRVPTGEGVEVVW